MQKQFIWNQALSFGGGRQRQTLPYLFCFAIIGLNPVPLILILSFFLEGLTGYTAFGENGIYVIPCSVMPEFPDTVPMDPVFNGEQYGRGWLKKRVPYYSPDELQDFRLHPVVFSDGTRGFLRQDGTKAPPWTIWVVTTSGEVFGSSTDHFPGNNHDSVHHSSLAGGKDVAAAGMIGRDGGINHQTGHYLGFRPEVDRNKLQRIMEDNVDFLFKHAPVAQKSTCNSKPRRFKCPSQSKTRKRRGACANVLPALATLPVVGDYLYDYLNEDHWLGKTVGSAMNHGIMNALDPLAEQKQANWDSFIEKECDGKVPPRFWILVIDGRAPDLLPQRIW